MVTVALCVCTCKRPAGLAKLLEAVAELDFAGRLLVIVVENDPAGEGLAVCRRIAPTYRWPLTCAIEDQRGISFARNRAIVLALEQEPDFIAMLDDDERPSREWLRELLRVQSATKANVVGGPVVPEFASPPPDWIINGRFFEGPCWDDGSEFLLSASNNFVAHAECFHALLPAPFDVDFALTLGHDAIFFRRLASRGYRMCWAARAVVHETVPSTRMNLEWLKQRQFSAGNQNVRLQRMFSPGLSNEITGILKTVLLLGLGSVYYLLGWPHRLSRARALLLISRGLGRIAAYRGVTHLEYATIHGS